MGFYYCNFLTSSSLMQVLLNLAGQVPFLSLEYQFSVCFKSSLSLSKQFITSSFLSLNTMFSSFYSMLLIELTTSTKGSFSLTSSLGSHPSIISFANTMFSSTTSSCPLSFECFSSKFVNQQTFSSNYSLAGFCFSGTPSHTLTVDSSPN